MKSLLLTFTLLCCPLWLTAQTSSNAENANSTSQQDSSIKGCLMSSDGNFTITDYAGIKYNLTGNTSRLRSNVEHEVEVTGKVASSHAEATNSPMSTDTSTGTQGTGSAMKQGVVQTFRVSRITKISDTCSQSK